MKDRILLRYGREHGTDRWDLWFALTGLDWENGADFPEGDRAFEYKDVWITVDHGHIQELLKDLPDVDAEIENVQPPENQ